MRQSTFTQEFTQTGPLQLVTGKIVVTMNYTTKTITGTNASTHDDYSTQVTLHKVETFINGQVYQKELEIRDESLVIIKTKELKKDLQTRIEKMSNEEPVKTFTQQMTELGFTTEPQPRELV